jgi:hypothetical protein
VVENLGIRITAVQLIRGTVELGANGPVSIRRGDRAYACRYKDRLAWSTPTIKLIVGSSRQACWRQLRR